MRVEGRTTHTVGREKGSSLKDEGKEESWRREETHGRRGGQGHREGRRMGEKQVFENIYKSAAPIRRGSFIAATDTKTDGLPHLCSPHGVKYTTSSSERPPSGSYGARVPSLEERCGLPSSVYGARIPSLEEGRDHYIPQQRPKDWRSLFTRSVGSRPGLVERDTKRSRTLHNKN